MRRKLRTNCTKYYLTIKKVSKFFSLFFVVRLPQSRWTFCLYVCVYISYIYAYLIYDDDEKRNSSLFWDTYMIHMWSCVNCVITVFCVHKKK